eukprot:2620355-Pyramimonas_sp.AAC.1
MARRNRQLNMTGAASEEGMSDSMIGYAEDTLALEGAERMLVPAAAPRAEEDGVRRGGPKRQGKASGAPPR